jgi:choline dehydrogenase
MFLSNSLLHSIDTTQRNSVAAENPPHSWQFFVEHFQNETQARRDPKYAYRQTNGSYYVGLEPPAAAEP